MAKYKYILTVIIILCTLITYAQPAQYTPMTASGYQMKRLKVDSTLHLPSFCGVPTLRGSTAKEGALAIDTCGDYLYMWTNSGGWDTINVSGGGGGSTTDTTSLSNRINLKIDSLKRSNDSVFAWINGVKFFQYTDSVGSGGGDFWKINGITTLTDDVFIQSDSIISFQGKDDEMKLFGVNSTEINLLTTTGVINLVGLNSTTDTSTYKPLGIDNDGKLAPLTSWVGGGGGGIDSLKRSSDSVYARKNGEFIFQFKDSVGVSGGGGGGGKIYYFNGGVNLGTFGGITMYELGDTAITGTAANFTRATTGNLANFITDANKPGLLQIPAGVWTIDAYLSEAGGGSNHAEIYAVLEKWNGSTITTIATSLVEEITNGNVIDLYTYGISVPTTTLSATDRIIIQFYIQNTNGKTVTLYTQNGYVGEVHTTFTTGIGALNGLTTATQTFALGTSGTDFGISSAGSTHTFNLPTASATNRGALLSADWSNFNGKIGASDTSVFQRKSIQPYSFLANNTPATANAQALPFKDTSGVYTQSPVWGTSAPTGATNHTYRWTRIGNMVTLNISLVYGTVSTNNTALTIPLPTDCPTPVKPTGLTAASNFLYPAYCNGGNTLNTAGNLSARGGIRSNSGNNGFEFNFTFTPNPFIFFETTVTYYTN